MRIFWKHLLLCTLIILLGENAAEKSLSYEDALAQNADFQDNDLYIDYRLPKSIEPVSYEIALIPNLTANNFTFVGFVTIKAVVKQATQEFALHVGNIQILRESLLINDEKVNMSHKYNKTTEKYHLNVFPYILKEKTELLISFTYNGVLNDNMIGFYRSSYYDKNGQLKWLAATQFQTTHARHAFPCFDEPSFKANFTIRILRSENYKCLSNMPGTTEELDGNIWDVFNESIPMSTYLVAFVVSEFESRGQDILTVWSRPSFIEQTNYALNISTAALKLFSEKFLQDYQLPKMDMVAVPDFAAGAMENWGLVTYREARLLYDEKESSAPAQQSVASVIVHELTHMWFGNLVTPEWWGYLWLSEAFARYFQYFGTAEIEQSWNMKEQFVVEQHQSALIVDGLESSLPMTRNVSTQSEIGKMGDSITYSKGASIVRMMDLTFGTNLFNSALREYLENNKEKGVGRPEALWTAIQNQTESSQLNLSVPIETIMNTWTTQAGYPVVSVTTKSKGVLRISQERFFLRNLDKTPTNVKWWVPLTWTTQSEPNFDNTIAQDWLSTEYDTRYLTIGPQEWVILNLQSSGFYRVNYDSNGWQCIFNALHNKNISEIHVLNRAGIVDDLLNLGRAGYQDYKTVLNGITYLKRENNYLPFKAAFNGLDYLNKRFAGHDNHILLKEYILSLISNIREKLGYEDRDNDDRLTVLLRREVNNWACNLDDEECKTVYLNKFAKWRANTSMRIKPNERTTAYCVAIRYGTSEDWEFLWQEYFNSNHTADQIVIINALGCSQNKTILERYLQFAITNYEVSRIRKQDSKSVFAAVYNSGLIGAEYILDFVQKHYNEMEKYYGEQGTIATILDGASQRFSTYRLVERFEQFIDKHKTELAPILTSLESSLKIAQYELKWYENASVSQALKEYNYRLPSNISPRKYFISVTPYLEIGNFTFDGRVKIEADVLQLTKQIILHSAEIEHHTINVTVNQIELGIKNYTTIRKYDFLIINLEEEVLNGTQLTIEITYTGHLNTSELRGFYKSSYINTNGETRWLAATHLEPIGARKMFPCFDEPALKALFTVEAIVPLNYRAVSNMRWKTIEDTDNSKIYTFHESVKMSTYLVAVIISDFKSLILNPRTTDEIGVLARPDAIRYTEYALSLISPIVTFFEDTFQLKYQLPKLYMVALPDFPSGAGENWGLLTYRESYLLYDEIHSSITSKQNTRNVIAHEISHQWFGNLVTPLWWKYLWLNEGFARYFEYHVPARAFNDTTLESQFVVEQVHSAFAADSSNSSHALSHDVYTPKEIRSLFDTITYNKGGSILRMIEKSYGTEIFYNSLTSYLKERKYNFVTPEHLYAALEKEVNEDQNITTFLNTWTTQPGYPVVHIKNVDDKTISLRQERFFFKKYERNSVNATWHIPITWATYNEPQEYFDTDPKLWLTEEETVINLTLFSLFNVQQSGYYRVNYEEAYWIKLINLLRNYTFKLRQIHEINRAAIIDDVMNLARADYIDYKIAISATMYLARENDYLPWRAFYNNLPYLNNRFRGRDIEGLYKKYLTSLIEPLYDKLLFTNKDGDHLTNMLRIHTSKWACKLDISDCNYVARLLFQEKRQGKIIPPNYREIVYCTAMKSDITNNTYDFLWNEYLNSNVTADKLVILSSLACSPKKDILKTLLKNAVTENYIRYQDSGRVFSNVYDESLIGVEVVMEVIKEYYDDLLRLHFGDHTKIESIVSALASRLSTYDLYNQYQKLLDWLAEKTPISKNSIDSYLSTAQYEFDWYEEKVPIIFEQLDKVFFDNTYRLPKTFQPELYNVTLIPHMENGTFNGTVQIYMKVKQNTTSITLNSHNLQISEMNIKVSKNYTNGSDTYTEPIQLSSIDHIENSQQLKIYLIEYVYIEENIIVDIEFNGFLNDNMQGFYRSSYTDSKGIQHWLATTQFEPTYARQAFPCFDEPAFKSRFTINIQRPKDYKTLSNMPCNISTNFVNENALDSCEVTEVMSTYLVAFVVSKFEPVDDSDEINVWGRPEVAQHGKFAQDIARKLIDELQEFTNINYSLPKLDLVGIPDFSMGAMENWGLATFREYGLFYDTNETTATYKKYIITVIAHELAHMWFGNLVTCEWWEYIWLNEGFAQYLEWYMANVISPNDKFMDQFVVYELQSALLNDASTSVHPMTNPVKTPEEISTIFDYVTYGKSASVLRMMFTAFGEEASKSALRDYLNKTSYSTARPTDLWKSFEPYVSISISRRNITIEEVMDSWTNQPGYPLVHATLKNSLLSLRQERFVLNKDANIPEFYWIPIRVVTSQSISDQITFQRTIWLGSQTEIMYINPINELFIVNYEQTGFYRVNYDTQSWLKLINELNSERFNIIPVLNRAQIIDDLFNLARARYTNYEVLMKASKYLTRETHHLPWKAFFNGLSYVYERFGENDQKLVKKHILNLLFNMYKEVGFNDRGNDTLLDELNREMILQWACKLDKPECIMQSKLLFATWREDNSKRIPRNARPAVYCTAIRKGTTDDWKFLWNQYLSTNFGSEQKIIINALGCSENKATLYNYLETAIKEYDPVTAEIRKQDVLAVFASVYSGSQLGVEITLNFLISNYWTMYNYFGNWNDVGTLFENVASHISDRTEYWKLWEFRIYAEGNIKGLREKLKSAVTIAETNLLWHERYSQIIVQWIKNDMSEDEPDSSTSIESLNIVFVTLIALISFFLSRN
ncbi:putative aminopeptidase-2 [Linepithema humile]|uniref:putative aminopeptidase-2 n=1 Tax=Linepithema humile TaxID=83485 RepID=UPI00351F356D